MGWFTSSSSNTNKQLTTNNNTSTQAGYEVQDEAQAVGVVGDNNNVTLTDKGALKVAQTIAQNALDVNENVFKLGFESTENAIEASQDTFKLGLKSNENIFGLALKSVEKAFSGSLNFASSSTKSEDAQNIDKLVGYIPIIMIIGGVFYVFKD